MRIKNIKFTSQNGTYLLFESLINCITFENQTSGQGTAEMSLGLLPQGKKKLVTY